jgi:hypothetical protein
MHARHAVYRGSDVRFGAFCLRGFADVRKWPRGSFMPLGES